jgi:N-acetyl-gamma-glutamyl-phosphate reductase
MTRIPVGIAGVTGYAGQELLRILRAHPAVRITALASSGRGDPAAILRAAAPLPVPVRAFDARAFARECRVAFLALPHAVSMQAAPALLDAGVTAVLDLSAAFRLKNPGAYPAHYGFAHAAPALLARAVYGLPELAGRNLKGARLVAIPGCYPTGALLPLAPLARRGWLAGRVVVDSKSGVTGAGRESREDLMFGEVHESVRAYGVLSHRHEPEIVQGLAAAGRPVRVTFVPHLIPMNRGILTTAHAVLKAGVTRDAVLEALRRDYRGRPFVRILDSGLPATRDVRGTNRCDIGVAVRGREAVLVSALDNLVKGAAGQAVQAFNVVRGLDEALGLDDTAGAP